jgi:hypothetical protein
MHDWQMVPLASLDDHSLTGMVIERFRRIQNDHFAEDPMTNPILEVEVRALRRSEGWCIFLLLTPWMLARIFLPEREPGLPLPATWRAEARVAAPYVVIGPAIELTLQGGLQRAHLNYDSIVGHYLVQPLVQSMTEFTSSDEVFAAWNEVLATRSRVMKEQQRDCPWQRELSRREFFTHLTGSRERQSD